MSFADALIDGSMPVPVGLNPGHRFRVYRNNVASALVNALAVRYPQVRRLVGEQSFAALAGRFALNSPPQSAVLIDYGADFPDFIAGHEGASAVAHLADVARLESAWWRAYHAADIAPLDASAFAALAQEKLASLVLVFHPSFGLVASAHPIASIWQDDAEGIARAAAEHVLVYRPEAEVIARVVAPDTAAFLKVLSEGNALGEAVQLASARYTGFDLQAQLTGLLSLRIITEFSFEEKS